MPIAAGNVNGAAPIDSAGTGAQLGPAGHSNIFVARLDDLLPTERVGVIRMDVEGEELNVLKGAKQIIAANLPVLQVAVYHRPEDLPNITKAVLALGDYRHFFLRTHRASFFDTFLYCYPANSCPTN